jgi:hypothetical protein
VRTCYLFARTGWVYESAARAIGYCASRRGGNAQNASRMTTMNAKADQKNFIAYRMVPVGDTPPKMEYRILLWLGEGNNVENLIYQSTG